MQQQRRKRAFAKSLSSVIPLYAAERLRQILPAVEHPGIGIPRQLLQLGFVSVSKHDGEDRDLSSKPGVSRLKIGQGPAGLPVGEQDDRRRILWTDHILPAAQSPHGGRVHIGTAAYFLIFHFVIKRFQLAAVACGRISVDHAPVKGNKDIHLVF